ncbi:MAG: HlyD family secretion protein [Pseudomonadota bacterium]|jgi:RND family efflux transporter MFP subunit
MQDDKSELLRSLSISGSDRGTSGGNGGGAGRRGSGRLVAGMALAGFVVGGAATAYYLFGVQGPGEPTAPTPVAAAVAQTAPATAASSPAPANTSQTAQAPPAPAPAPAAARNPGALVASGYVVARRMATVSAETFGRVTEVLVEEGMRVEQGQVLARLDDTLAKVDLGLAQARVGTVEAQLAGTRAELAEARRVLERARTLRTRDFQTEAALTSAESRVAVLAAEVQRLDASVAVARLEVQREAERLDKLTIRAPFAGMVVDKNAQPGEIISPNSAGGGFTRTGICTIVDQESLEIEVDVNEAFINRVSPGQRAEAVLDAWPDWKIPARVIAVIPTANREKATIKVRIGLDVKDGRVLRDMAAKVTFLDGAA